jgi:hypothetical protein
MCLMNLPHQKVVTKMSCEIKLLLWELTFLMIIFPDETVEFQYAN